MQNEIVINVDAGQTRVALLEQSVFTELHIEREAEKSVVGNVVKGRVSRVLPGMQAAFVDIGLEKAAFLYVGDYFSNTPGDDDTPEVPRHRRRRNGRGQPPKIETVLSEGQEIVVQIAKAPIGTKGARITSNISIPGRHLVLTPSSRRVGVSRRIGSDRERRRLREIVERLRPKDLGFIIRTAGENVREADLEADIRYLHSIWQKIQLGHVEKSAPAELHAEHDLELRIIRDFANDDTKRIVVDDLQAHANLVEFIGEFVADPKPEIEHYTDPVPVFDHLGIESEIHANLERKVWLKSGGSLIVDQCEALTAIDVNTGRFVGKRDLEETVFKTNLEAVKEVVHQLRFRNIGGLIIIDLIDMESAEHRDKVYRALQDALRSDKSRTNILKISELGLVEMTRKRTRESLVQTLCEPCSHCEGRGYILSGDTVAYNILREIRNDLPRFCGRRIAISVSPRVAEMLLSHESKPLHALEQELDREIEIRARPGLHQEQFEVEALDAGPPVDIKLAWLRDPAEIAAEERAADKNKGDKNKNGRGGRGKGGRRRGRGRPEDAAAGKTEAVEAEDERAAEGAEPSADEGVAAAAETPSPDGTETGAGSGTPVLGEPAQEAQSPEGAEPDGASSQPSDRLPISQPGPTPGVAPAEPSPQSGSETVAEPAEEPTPNPLAETAAQAMTSAEPLDDEAESRILPRSEDTR
ncbi:MAG: Rne/Rng family ribonuclease [Deltaproteobacteria bacterium]|nr:Rne/Rng family ribonuclease [Deltaproteobacteria bacterium]